MAYTINHYITDWVEESRALMQPDKVLWIDGTETHSTKPRDAENYLRNKIILSAETVTRAAEALGTQPGRTLVLEDSYNGVRAGAAGGFVTVMVPDLLPADDEMRGLYTMECTSLNEVLAKLKTGEL